MKLTAILLLSACLAASADGLTQKVSLKVNNASLEKVFTEIKKQTGYSIFCNYKLLEKAKPVTIEVSNAPIDEVMKLCLKDQGLDYEIAERSIVIKEKPGTSTEVFQDVIASSEATKQPPPIDISGRVTDPDGNPLVGANVKVKGTEKGTTTDVNGVFVLKGVDDNAMLEISYVGYQTLSVAVGGKTSIVTALKIDVQNMNEVVINKGYYVEKQRLSTGNISRVSGKDIERLPVSNPMLAIEGRVPGLVVTPTNGLTGSGVTVRVQGQNSIQSGNDPLYIIDGVPFTSQTLPTTNGGPLGRSGAPIVNSAFTGGVGNPLNFINSSDIESVEILKDADATAIYGSRGGNGVILITTKRGKKGQPSVSANLQTGWGKVTRKLDLLNTEQYLTMRHEAFANDGAVPTNTDYDLNGVWDTTRYTDWQDELIGNTARFNNVNVGISGGAQNISYLINGTYQKQTTVFPGDFSDKRGSFHINLNNLSATQKLNFLVSINYLVDDNQLPLTDLTNDAITLAPNAPNLYNSDGSLNWMPTSTGNSSFFNPLRNILKRYNNKSTNLVSNLQLAYKILPNLEIKSSFGYTNLLIKELTLNPFSAYQPENLPSATSLRTSTHSNSETTTWIIEPQLNYKVSIRQHKFEALVGTTFQKNNSDGETLSASGFSSDLVLEDIRSASSVKVTSTINSVYKYNALFGRINYNLHNKYLLNFTARRDGSSRFGSENLFHNFGAIGVGWVFSEERIFSRNKSVFSFGKFRGSYGTTGNDQISDYRFLDLYNAINSGIAYQASTGLGVVGIANPYLQWEETKKLQVGIDLGFFYDRVILNSTFVRNQSSNQLLQYALPIISGFGGMTTNFPATVRNSSVEIAVNSTNVKHEKFSWISNINFTIPKNKLVAFPNLDKSTYGGSGGLIIGQPAYGLVRTYQFMGVDSATGIYQFLDKQGHLTTSPDPSTDNNAMFNTLPKFYGGFQNTITWKGFEMDFLFQFTRQKGMRYLFNTLPGIFNSGNGNQPVRVIQRWQKPGDNANIQQFNQSFALFSNAIDAANSNFGYGDASYLRLRTLSIAFNLPQNVMNKVHLKRCRFYVLGQNVFTITNYDGLDPELKTSTALPALRIITTGLEISL